mmetsp:Transcript_20657/g.31365  ORF Transcript_20657/g.31365 Transcript_20657/m.31365 type:complete len:144 (+) Transcript_20657:886-1317(+)
MPGLALNIAMIQPQTRVGNWDADKLARAIRVLARSMPIPSDIEAGCIKVAIDSFAEMFHGVKAAESCGRARENAGYNAFLDSGRQHSNSQRQPYLQYCHENHWSRSFNAESRGSCSEMSGLDVLCREHQSNSRHAHSAHAISL